MPVILLVEDNPHIMKINSEMLSLNGYQILKAESAEECRNRLYWNTVDLVVLDILLPDGNGIDLCREIKEKYHVPILFLTALGENKDIVEGLRAGGDDYLAKPYDLEVLMAHIEARIRSRNETDRYICYGCLKLDMAMGCGFLNGDDMLLTQKEFLALMMLVRNSERVVNINELSEKIMQSNSESSIKSTWTLISRIRKKLKSEKSRLEISSIRGEGYKLEQF